MAGSGYLNFDPTDANTQAASANVGAYVRAGTDGDLIGSETLNSLEWLRVTGPIIDSAGNEVAVTGNALDVNIASGSLTITEQDVYDEDTAHASGNKGTFIMSVRVDDLTSIPATALAGTELDYQAFISGPNGELLVGANQLDIDDLNATDDAVQAWMFDGTGTAITSTGGAIDVNIASGDVDDDLADTAILASSTAVSTTAVNVVASALSNRKHLYLANEGNIKLYFGQTGVTTANGFPLYMREKLHARIGASVAPQIIGGTGASSEDLRVLELS